jgi:hypothetical protein
MREPYRPISPHQTQSAQLVAGIATAIILAYGSLCGVARAQTTKGFMDYLKPTPITCSPLSSATWGVAGVLPRDTCNGIESTNGAGVAPTYLYWDGQIIAGKDGTFHMFMSTWADSAGFNPGWTNSESYHATSNSVLGPYTRKDYVWSSGSHHGHNTSAVELPDGTYAVIVSEVVPFTIYTSSSLDGPWTACPNSSGELIQTNGLSNCGDGHLDSNVSLFPRSDGKFEIVQRHGIIAIANTVCGPYTVQKPTWTYPAANTPTCDTSVYPKRTSIPEVSNPTFTWEEDPHIWLSGGTYHIIYSGSGDRVGWHVYSSDGLTNWKDGGYAWSPRDYQKIFCYEGGTTCNQWYKMERPGVVLENGHPTHITWAVSDVDKDNSIPGGSNHGSKVIVVPFDGVTFDNDYGVGGSSGTGGAGGSSGTGGAVGSSGRDGGMGGSGSGGATGTGGVGGSGSGGATSTGGRSGSDGGLSGNGSGGATSTGGLGGSASGGTTGTGGRSGGTGGSTVVASGGAGGSGGAGTGGVTAGSGGVIGTGGSTTGSGAQGIGGSGSGGQGGGNSGTGGNPTKSGGGSASGCACTIQKREQASGGGALLLLGFVLFSQFRRRRSAKTP